MRSTVLIYAIISYYRSTVIRDRAHTAGSMFLLKYFISILSDTFKAYRFDFVLQQVRVRKFKAQ